MLRLLFLPLAALLCPGSEDALHVLYTGRLLGHFRYPDGQGFNAKVCPTDLAWINDRGGMLFEMIREQRKPGTLLVSMGDVFAPQLEARAFNRVNAEPRKLKDRFVWIGGGWQEADEKNWRDAGAPPMDNVACFLMRAGYDAMAPGKHDFYFGPERLRQLAMLMERGARDRDGMPLPEYSRVRMVASNLTIETRQPGAVPAPMPPAERRWWAAQGSALPRRPLRPVLPPFVLPWLREFVIDNARDDRINSGGATSRIQEARLCDSAPGNSSEISDWDRCRKLEGGELDPRGLARYRLPEGLWLKAGSNHGICFEVDAASELANLHSTLRRPAGAREGRGYICAAFTVKTPFFEQPEPYRFDVARNVAIFGVVDRNFRQLLAPLNSGWVNENQRYDTVVGVLDPVEALRQTMQMCLADQNGCAKARKVLLAEMPSGPASLLLKQLDRPFDLTITQTDRLEGTGNEHRKVTLSDDMPAPRFMVSPTAMYAPRGMRVRLHSAVVGHTSSSRTLQHDVGWRFSPHDNFASAQPTLETGIAAVFKRWDFPETFGGSSKDEAYARRYSTAFLLETMRTAVGADIALMQARDLFEPALHLFATAGPNDLQDILDRLYWKNDYLVRLEVTGAALRRAIATSRQYEGEDKLGTSVERDRGLLTAGIHTDPVSGTLLVNGQPLEDGALYSVAATDHIGMGDTGYPELAAIPSLPPLRLRRHEGLVSLSGLMCRTIADAMPSAVFRCATDGKNGSKSQFDYTKMQPPDRDARLSFGQRFAESLKFWKHRDVLQGASEHERLVQNDTFASISLERLEGGYSMLNHGFSREELSRRFGGVQEARATAIENNTVTTAMRLRVRRGGGVLSPYGLFDSSWARNRQGNERNLTNNFIVLEGGVNPRMWPKFIDYRQWRLIAGGRYQTNLQTPFTKLAVSDGQTIYRSTRREQRLLARAGLRWQSATNWFEAGWQTGANLRSMSTFELMSAAGAIVCQAPAIPDARTVDERNAGIPAAAGTHTAFNNCVRGASPDSPLRVSTRTLGEHGPFLDARIAIPLPIPGRWAWVIENRGNVYFDAFNTEGGPLDTLVANSFANSLSIPVVGNFRLTPRIEWFVYANRKAVDWFTSWQTTVNLQYRFDWRTGMRWNRALRYPNPPPGRQ